MRRSPKPGSNLALVFMVVIVVVMAVVVGFIIGNWMLGYLLGPQEMETVSYEPLTEEVLHVPEEEEEEDEDEYLAPSEMEEISLDGTYLIQLGAFQEMVNAQNLKEELQEKGYSAFMTEERPYRVQVGMFRTREEAEELKARLEADGYEVFISR